MELNSFSTRVPGKWVLAGEHAVLRGKNAIAIPHPEFSLELSFSPGHRSDQLICRDLPDVLLEVILHRLNLKSAPVGSLSITSSIPQSSGLGSSAALSVAFVKWAARLEGWPEASWFEKARSLEDHFHGRSSGMDVAAVLSNGPIEYRLSPEGPQISVLFKDSPTPARFPRFTFHDTGIRGATRQCVEKVQAITSAKLDDAMNEAAFLAREGLLEYHERAGHPALQKIAQAMKLSQACFSAWGLIPAPIAAQAAALEGEGALGVKLTGAGGGGFLVALWAH